MNRPTDVERLRHVLDFIGRIETYTAAGRDVFLTDQMVQDAVLRNFEIIGEAARMLSPATKDRAPTIEWRKIVGMRDHVAHGYFGIDLDLVWDTTVQDLPLLRAGVETLLAELAHES